MRKSDANIALVVIGLIFGYSVLSVFTGRDKSSEFRVVSTEDEVRAAPYLWPAGCPQKSYGDGGILGNRDIPNACADQKYYFGHGNKTGWLSESGKNFYYRVGDDALDIVCPIDFFGKFNCKVNFKARGYFGK